MSRVFLAEERALGRRVVVKIVPADVGEGVNVERFRREIQLAARLQHAHIVPVHNVGEVEGMPYYTMPYVVGESLRLRLAHGAAFPIGEATGILRDVSKALAYAHDEGVVHRDIKPDNVLLSGGSAVVTDFGIAKAISAARGDGVHGTLTEVGVSLGTPAYMAPEQAAADPSADHRVDIYAFGCLAYELLAGRPPFTAKSPQKLLAAHMADTPAPISDLRPDSPHAVAALVMRCLEKDPDRRPQSAAELVRVLDSVTSGAALPAQPPLVLGGPQMLRRAIATYIGAFLAAAGVARAAMIAWDVPDWVFPGTLIVMALGLPVVLFTAYTHRLARSALTATPTYTPGGTQTTRQPRGALASLALKAGPHMSWRRTALGGAAALGGFVLLIAGYMTLRAEGIGSAGSLIAAGKLDARDPILVADFRVQNADSTLGRVISGATTAMLVQSKAVRVMAPEAIATALKRMELPVTTTLQLPVARQLALRSNVKAIVDGEVTGLGPGAGFLVAIRLVATETAEELVSFHETAADAPALIRVADKLSRDLRGKMGESLRAVRATPRYSQVTTASLDALRKYVDGARADQLEADHPRAIALLREAVAIDTTFAEAWRKLGIVLSNAGRPRSEIDSALTQAFRFRSKLPERERLLTEGSYFFAGPGRDRGRAATIFESSISLGDSGAAADNLAILLTNRREFARAESTWRLFLVSHRLREAYPYLARAQLFQGKFAAAESAFALGLKYFPTDVESKRGRVDMLYMRGDTAGFRRALDSVVVDRDTSSRAWAVLRLSQLALLHGRVAESERLIARIRPDLASLSAVARLNRLAANRELWVRTAILDHRAEYVKDLDATVAAVQTATIPEADRAYMTIARAYALAGRPDRARAIIARAEAETRDTSLKRVRETPLHNALGNILVAEGKPADAIRELRLGDLRPDGPTSACALCLAMELARAFDAAKMADSAIAQLERVQNEFYPERIINDFDPYYLALSARQLAELYEAKGDRVKAAAYFQKFITLWAHADAELQPQVADARRRLQRLLDPERPR